MGNFKKKRDSHEIVAVILKSASHGATKTHIISKANISHSQAEHYLPLLVEKGLLANPVIHKRGQTIRFFKTSDSGRRLLENLQTLETLLIERPTGT